MDELTKSEAIETGIDCWDRDIQRFVRSRRISEYHPFTAYFEQLPEWDGTDRVSALARQGVRRPGMGERFPPLDAWDSLPNGCSSIRITIVPTVWLPCW